MSEMKEVNLLLQALQVSSAVPACTDATVLRRMLSTLDGPTVFEQTAKAVGFTPEGGTSLIPVTS